MTAHESCTEARNEYYKMVREETLEQWMFTAGRAFQLSQDSAALSGDEDSFKYMMAGVDV